MGIGVRQWNWAVPCPLLRHVGSWRGRIVAKSDERPRGHAFLRDWISINVCSLVVLGLPSFRSCMLVYLLSNTYMLIICPLTQIISLVPWAG